jgi:hypothetical protein
MTPDSCSRSNHDLAQDPRAPTRPEASLLPKGVVGLVLLIRTRDELPMFSSTIPEAEVVKHLRELADTIEKRLQ